MMETLAGGEEGFSAAEVELGGEQGEADGDDGAPLCRERVELCHGQGGEGEGEDRRLEEADGEGPALVGEREEREGAWAATTTARAPLVVAWRRREEGEGQQANGDVTGGEEEEGAGQVGGEAPAEIEDGEDGVASGTENKGHDGRPAGAAGSATAAARPERRLQLARDQAGLDQDTREREDRRRREPDGADERGRRAAHQIAHLPHVFSRRAPPRRATARSVIL
mmetsp:Transcript_27737/g.85085  ORF Transcript_27737/g.85085 Transcript_27737/m.85085 type:complete len:225 (-) Transcript_27737:258-932(-)